MSIKKLKNKLADIAAITEQQDLLFKPTSYSGRFMYGKYCLGISVDSQYAFDEIYDHTLRGRLTRNLRWDNLGLGYIAYWPSVTWDRETVEAWKQVTGGSASQNS
jgi:hypothetical protein